MLDRLYTVISQNGLYTRSYDDFLNQFRDEGYRQKVFREVQNRGLFTGDYNQFVSKFNHHTTTSRPMEYSSFIPKQNQIQIKPKTNSEKAEGWIGALTQGWKSGFDRSQASDETLGLFVRGGDADKYEYEDFVAAVNKYNQSSYIHEFEKWSKSFDKHREQGRNYAMSTLLSIADEGIDGLAGVMVQSLSGLLSKESLGAGLAVGGGAAVKFKNPYLAAGGFMAGANAMSETMITFAGAIQEELQSRGLDFNAESVEVLLEEPDFYRRIRNTSLARGITIGAVEGVFTLLGGKASASTIRAVNQATKGVSRVGAKVAAGTAGTAVAGTTEMIGGMTGEAAGLTIEGKPLDPKEIIVEGIAGIGGAPITLGAGAIQVLRPGQYKINGENKTVGELMDVLNTATDAEVAMMDIDIKNDSPLSNTVNDRKRKFILDNQLDKDITNKADRARIVELEMEIKKLEGNKTNFDKQKLSDLKAEQKELMDKYVKADIARAEVFADKLGVDVVARSETDFIKFIDKFNKDNKTNYSAEGLGSIITDENGKDTIVINKDAASKAQKFTTGQHEILHAILKKSLKNNDAITVKLGQELKNYLDKMSTKDLYLKDGKGNFMRDKNGQKIANSDFINRFNQYSQRVKSGKLSEAALFEEVFTLASEAMTNGDLTFEQSTFDKIIDLFKQFYKQVFGGELVIDNAKDMFNFIKEYNKDFKAGRVKEQYKGKLTFGKNLKERAKNIVLDAKKTPQQKESLIDDVDPFEQYRLNPTERKETVNRLYEEGGLNNLGEIIKPFLPIAKDLVKSRQRFDNVGRQEREDLIDEYTSATIEKLIQHIQAFDPSKNKDFDAYVNSYVEFKRGTAAKQLQTKETKLTESQERKAKKKADDTVQEVDTAPISSKITLETETQKKFNTNVEKAVDQATKLIALGKSPKQIQAFLQGKFRKQNIAKDIKNSIKDKKVYKKFLQDNFETFFNDVNVETLNKRFRGDKNNPDLFSKSTDKRYQRSDTSQPYQFVKQPWSQVKDKYLDYFLNDTPQNINNRKDKIVEEISNYMSFEAAQDITQSIEFKVNKDIIELSKLQVADIIKKTRSATNIRQKFSLTPDQLKTIQKPKYQKVLMDILSVYNLTEDGYQTPEGYAIHRDDILRKIKNKKDKEAIEKFLKAFEPILEKAKNNQFTKYKRLDLITSDPKVREYIGKFFNVKNTTDQQEIADATLNIIKQFPPDVLKQLGFAKFGKVKMNNFKRFGLVTKNMDVDNAKWKKDNPIVKQLIKDTQKHIDNKKFELDEIDSHEKLQLESGIEIDGKFVAWDFSKHAIYKDSTMSTKIETILKSDLKNKTQEIKKLMHLIKLNNRNAQKLQVYYNLKLAKLLKKGNTKTKANIYKIQAYSTNAIDSIFKGAVQLDVIEIIEGKKQFNGTYTQKNKKGELITHLQRLYIEHFKENANSLVDMDKLNNQYITGKIDDNTYITEALKITGKMKIGMLNSKDTATMDNIARVVAAKMRGGKEIGNANILKLVAVDSKIRKNYYHISTGKNVNEILADAIIKNGMALNKQPFSLDIEKFKNYDKAMDMARRKNPPKKGASFIDFDDTLATTKSRIKYEIPRRLPDGRFNWKVVGWGAMPDKGFLTPAEFAKQHDDLVAAGAKFDYSEFNEVKGGKKGPFFNKAKALKDKFGNNDIFILSARPAEAANAIHTFLKGVGLNIKPENIIGLEDGRPEAKAEVIVDKAALGYNNFFLTSL